MYSLTSRLWGDWSWRALCSFSTSPELQWCLRWTHPRPVAYTEDKNLRRTRELAKSELVWGQQEAWRALPWCPWLDGPCYVYPSLHCRLWTWVQHNEAGKVFKTHTHTHSLTHTHTTTLILCEHHKIVTFLCILIWILCRSRLIGGQSWHQPPWLIF